MMGFFRTSKTITHKKYFKTLKNSLQGCGNIINLQIWKVRKESNRHYLRKYLSRFIKWLKNEIGEKDKKKQQPTTTKQNKKWNGKKIDKKHRLGIKNIVNCMKTQFFHIVFQIMKFDLHYWRKRKNSKTWYLRQN